MSNFDQKNQKINAQINADKVSIEVKQITCPNCQYGNPPKAKFCAECGTSLIFKCPLCNNETPLGAKFCSGCGKQITKIISEIGEATTKRGGSERELVFNWRIKFFAQSTSITLDINEYVAKKEENVMYYKSDISNSLGYGTLYLTNKKLIILGRHKDFENTDVKETFPLNEITEVGIETSKFLFMSSSYLKIICNGNARRFGISEKNIPSWIESIKMRL